MTFFLITTCQRLDLVHRDPFPYQTLVLDVVYLNINYCEVSGLICFNFYFKFSLSNAAIHLHLGVSLNYWDIFKVYARIFTFFKSEKENFKQSIFSPRIFALYKYPEEVFWGGETSWHFWNYEGRYLLCFLKKKKKIYFCFTLHAWILIKS